MHTRIHPYTCNPAYTHAHHTLTHMRSEKKETVVTGGALFTCEDGWLTASRATSVFANHVAQMTISMDFFVIFQGGRKA